MTLEAKKGGAQNITLHSVATNITHKSGTQSHLNCIRKRRITRYNKAALLLITLL